MAIADKTHWVGVFLLFLSSILLLVTTISAPVINHLSLLHVTLRNGTTAEPSRLSFGTLGYCVLNAQTPNSGTDWCTRHEIGYAPAHIVAAADHSSISEIASGTSDALTRVLVLHPVECGLAFIAFLLSCEKGMIGSFAGAMFAFVTWILVIISLAVDFSLFGILHHHVNAHVKGSKATFGSGLWCLVAAFVTLLLGMLIVFFTCCSARREKKRGRAVEKSPEAAPRKKKFGIF